MYISPHMQRREHIVSAPLLQAAQPVCTNSVKTQVGLVKTCLWNDLLHVDREVKLYTFTHSLIILASENFVSLDAT